MRKIHPIFDFYQSFVFISVMITAICIFLHVNLELKRLQLCFGLKLSHWA